MKSPAGKVAQTNGQTPRAQKRKSGVLNTPVLKNNTPAKPANTPAKGKMSMTPNQKKKLLSPKKQIKEEEEEEEEEVVEDVEMEDDESDDVEQSDEENEESDGDDDDGEEEDDDDGEEEDDNDGEEEDDDDEAEVNADELVTVKKEELSQAQRRKLAKDKEDKPLNTVILIKNCLTATRKHQLSLHFAKYGTITAMWMKYQSIEAPVRDEKTKGPLLKQADNKQNRPRRMTGRTALFYIRFQNMEEAEKAVEGENGKVFQGRHLSVEKLDGKTKFVKDCDADKTIYVSNIPSPIEEEDLWTFFRTYGEVANVRLLRSFTVKVMKQYAFVVFKTEKAAKEALEVSPQTICGEQIYFTKFGQEYVKSPKPALSPKSDRVEKTFTSSKPAPGKKAFPVKKNMPPQKKVKLTQKASAK